ncbi:MAG: hypothetical protein CO002_03500, partial [Candidatus Portnoybacteria bacterium CG_4_8_14_3_um_filter_44_10]
ENFLVFFHTAILSNFRIQMRNRGTFKILEKNIHRGIVMVKTDRFGSILLVLLVALLSISPIGCAIVQQPSNNSVVTTIRSDKTPAKNAVGDKNSETDIRKEFGVTNYQLTPKEQEGLRWIKKAKVFAHEKLGFKLMWNYTKFNEGIKLTSIFYHRKDGLFPFSQLDGERVVALSKRFGKDEASEKGGWLIKGI